MPETSKYPPTNETIMIIPPTFRDWTSTQQQQFNIFGSGVHPITPAAGVQHNPTILQSIQQNDLVGINFRADWDDEEEVSIMVEGTLTVDSAMEDLMADGDVCAVFLGDANSLYKYLVQNRSGGRLTLKWDKFKGMTVNNFMQIKNVHDDYIIVMKRITM